MAQTVRYDALAVFVGPLKTEGSYTSGEIKQFQRVQSTEYGIEIQRENVAGLGTAAVQDGVLQSPFVNLSFDYLITDGRNEQALGLIVDGNHGVLANIESGQNDYFMLLDKTPKMVLAIGNGMLERYSVNGRVGGFLQGTAGIRAYNIKLDEGTSGNPTPRIDTLGHTNESTSYQLPNITQGISNREDGYIEDNIYIGPKDIHATFPNNSAFGMLFSGAGASYLQSFDLAINLERNEVSTLGEKYPFSRCLKLPVDISLRTEFVVNSLVADKIQNYLCNETYDIDIDIKSSNCSVIGEDWDTVNNISKLKYVFRGMKFKGMSSSDSINNRKTIDVEWGVQVGNLYDLQRNLFISGNFGRYAFPPIAWRDVSGEQSITGNGLRPLVREVTYERVKADSAFPDFNVDFSGDFDIKPSDIDYASLQYRGTTGTYLNSGKFGSGLAKEDFLWNSDSFSTSFENLPKSGFAQKFSNLKAGYFIGFPGHLDSHSGLNYFYTKGEGMNYEQMTYTISNLPSFATAQVESGRTWMDAYEPYYFNILHIGITDPYFPTGQAFTFDVIAATPKLKRLYTISATAPYSYHINLPRQYSGSTNFWFEPYDPLSVTTSGDNILSFKESSIKRRSLSPVGTPKYRLEGLSGKSYVGFDGSSRLQYTGFFQEDYTNFTFFLLTSGDADSSANASLFHLHNNRVLNTGLGTVPYSGHVNIGRVGGTENMSIYASNISSGQTFVVPSGFQYGKWTINTFYYDGQVIRGRRNGVKVPLSGVLAGIGKNNYTHLTVGSGFKGGLAEFISIPFQLSDDDMTSVEDYLRYKWRF